MTAGRQLCFSVKVHKRPRFPFGVPQTTAGTGLSSPVMVVVRLPISRISSPPDHAM